ncbi:MAG: hypothetical protein HC923_11290 [Myxococcales bacterium]|nr:hypothetical protein [Myxococcales bacterium]
MPAFGMLPIVQILELAGTPSEMGEAMGEACRAEIRELYRRRISNAVEQAATLGHRTLDEGAILAIAERCLPEVRRFSEDGYAELRGIAKASELSLAGIWATAPFLHNGSVPTLYDLLSPEAERPATSSWVAPVSTR